MYPDGLAIGAATILAVLYANWCGTSLPQCLSVGVCVGLALDFVIRKALSRGARHRG